MSCTGAVYIPDKFESIAIDLVRFPAHYAPLVEGVMIPHGFVKDRVERMAEQIYEDLRPQCGEDGLYILCILKGSYDFHNQLNAGIKRMNNMRESLKIFYEFIRAKSYENDKSSGGITVTGMGDLSKVLANKTLLVVEDIVDTGHTLTKLLDHLQQFNPRAVKVASLLLKRTPLHNGIMPDYIGFSVPDRFIVGYGMDYNQHFRDLQHICVINETGRVKYSESFDSKGDCDSDSNSNNNK